MQGTVSGAVAYDLELTLDQAAIGPDGKINLGLLTVSVTAKQDQTSEPTLRISLMAVFKGGKTKPIGSMARGTGPLKADVPHVMTGDMLNPVPAHMVKPAGSWIKSTAWLDTPIFSTCSVTGELP